MLAPMVIHTAADLWGRGAAGAGVARACVSALFRASNSAVTSSLRAASFASSSAEEVEPGLDIVTRRRVMERGVNRLHTTPYGVLLNQFRGLKGWCVLRRARDSAPTLAVAHPLPPGDVDL